MKQNTGRRAVDLAGQRQIRIPVSRPVTDLNREMRKPQTVRAIRQAQGEMQEPKTAYLEATKTARLAFQEHNAGGGGGGNGRTARPAVATPGQKFISFLLPGLSRYVLGSDHPGL